MPPTTVPALTPAQKDERIRAVIQQAGDDLRRKYPVLRHQDAIGATILIVSLLGMLGTAALYFDGLIAWWVCIPVAAILRLTGRSFLDRGKAESYWSPARPPGSLKNQF